LSSGPVFSRGRFQAPPKEKGVPILINEPVKIEMQELFQLAAKYYYKKYKKKGGSQKKFAKDLGVSQSYLSSVINGSRSASLDLLNKIAITLYGPFDKFLSVGRRIKEGLEPSEEEKHMPEDAVETLIAKLTFYVMDNKKMSDDLMQKKNFFEQVVEHLPSGVFVTDRNDMIFFANQFMSVLEGTPVEHIIGINVLSVKSSFSAADAKNFIVHYSKAKKTLKPIFFKNIPVAIAGKKLVRQTGWIIPRLKDGNYDGMICTVNGIYRKERRSNKKDENKSWQSGNSLEQINI